MVRRIGMQRKNFGYCQLDVSQLYSKIVLLRKPRP
jgi:hypothetical protein